MRSGKVTLEDSPEGEVGFAIGLVCAEKSYKVTWQVNDILQCNLERTDDWRADPADTASLGFDLFVSENELLKTDMFLIRNKQSGYSASKIFALYDYLLFIFGEVDIDSREKWCGLLSENKMFSLVKLLDLHPSDIKF